MPIYPGYLQGLAPSLAVGEGEVRLLFVGKRSFVYGEEGREMDLWDSSRRGLWAPGYPDDGSLPIGIDLGGGYRRGGPQEGTPLSTVRGAIADKQGVMITYLHE